MRGILKQSQIDYVLYHLKLQTNISDDIKKLFRFEKADSRIKPEPGTILFMLSDHPFSDDTLQFVENIPVLYPLDDSNEIYSWEKDTLIFRHDFFKSAFHLLSGYQETITAKRDKYDRFPYINSLQERLNIVEVPVVNYYFEFISRGINTFCNKNNIPIYSLPLFDEMGFMLTHDVDIIDTFTFRDVLFRLKRLFLPSDSTYSLGKRAYYLWHYTINYLRFFKRRNPHWDFEYLVNEAKSRDFKSVFYFLQKEYKREDSVYKFSNRRIRKLFAFLGKMYCEIGIHGPCRSAVNQEVLAAQLKDLTFYSGQEITGIRQHRLIHKHTLTACIQENEGLKYDASLGFAEHEGFRNSFCLPFKLYNFEEERMMKIWQIPLIVMDATIFMYRKIDFNTSCKSVSGLIEECNKFNGLFTLLWHNGNFDRENYPFGKELFEWILDEVKKHKVESVTGRSLMNDFLNNRMRN